MPKSSCDNEAMLESTLGLSVYDASSRTCSMASSTEDVGPPEDKASQARSVALLKSPVHVFTTTGSINFVTVPIFRSLSSFASNAPWPSAGLTSLAPAAAADVSANTALTARIAMCVAAYGIASAWAFLSCCLLLLD